MRIAIPVFVATLWLAPAVFAQDAAAAGIDGSAPGKILLVLRDLPPGQPAMIVREPAYLNVRQRSLLFFSPTGTPEELALALAAFDRIRREDGEIIQQSKTVHNIGRTPDKIGRTRASLDLARDSANKAYRDMYLREMQSVIELVHAQPEKDLCGLGKVRWVQVTRPPLLSKP